MKCMYEAMLVTTIQNILKDTILNHIKQCSNLKTLESIYATMFKTNFNQDCFLMNQFITASSSFSSFNINFAISTFTQITKPNTLVYNALIKACVHSHSSNQALLHYIHMLRSSVIPSSYSFSSLIKACTLLTDAVNGKTLHGHVWKYGFDSHVFVQTTLVEFYSSLGYVCDARKVFDEMSARDVYAWTTMISAYVRNNDVESAEILFVEMPEGKNTATWNAVIDGYAKLGNIERVEFFFKEIPSKDIISWTTLMSCYLKNKRYGEVVKLFHEMVNEGKVVPDEVAITTVISACAHLGALGFGKEVHFYLMVSGFGIDVYIGSSLIDMYAKCGSLERSLLVFYKLKEKNLFCWNSMIDGLAAHGYAKEALRMFAEMEREGIRPNRVTFVSVLTACTHAGFIQEGRRFFTSMIEDYCISPQVEHYGCMVDLLSKGGLLEDALEMIRGMRFEPNSFIWGALLNGCKVHRNLEIARVTVRNLMILEPSNSGHYSLLVNMYAEVNRWSDVAKIRTEMKDLGVEKRCPGSSWIEINKEIHVFAASDKCHPSYGQVHLLLVELDEQLRLAGFVPEMGSVLY
ncbi:putative tetratricopeptide-like helical domain-containing protein [Medicago truncatula]|nr:pentatricopeptide repeat-containing protein At1g06143 [Medicago truncatula]XP_024625908.1 pentatricopeptide repeat-containing protein At1g06143 [Medicago truncatula]RHN45812.1 putative tetratricopeptide-like helical domain-containing protein [Medicago truncatula]